MEKERHFEDIMNDAEKLSANFPDNPTITPLAGLKLAIDKVTIGSTLSSYDQASAHNLVGEILWEVCAFCKKLEGQGITVNSAAALQSKINEMKERLLDPE